MALPPAIELHAFSVHDSHAYSFSPRPHHVIRFWKPRGYAAAHCGKALPFRQRFINSVRGCASSMWPRSRKSNYEPGCKPEAYRDVLRQSRPELNLSVRRLKPSPLTLSHWEKGDPVATAPGTDLIARKASLSKTPRFYCSLNFEFEYCVTCGCFFVALRAS